MSVAGAPRPLPIKLLSGADPTASWGQAVKVINQQLELGETDAALEVAIDSLARLRRAHPKPLREYCTAASVVASLQERSGAFEQAEKHWREALEVSEAGGPEFGLMKLSLGVALALNLRIQSKGEAGAKRESSRTCLGWALRGYDKLISFCEDESQNRGGGRAADFAAETKNFKEHAISALVRYAEVCQEQGRFPAVVKYLEKAILLSERYFGTADERTSRLVFSLGETLHDLRRYGAAQKLLCDYLSSVPHNEATGALRRQLNARIADLLLRRGKFGAARKLALKTLSEMPSESADEEVIGTMSLLHYTLGHCFLKAKMLARAGEHFESAIEFEEKRKIVQLRVLVSAHSLAGAAYEQRSQSTLNGPRKTEHLNRAERHLKEALFLADQENAGVSELAYETRLGWFEFLYRLDRLDEALVEAKTLQAVADALWGKQSSEVVESLRRQAAVHQDCERYGKAEALLESAVPLAVELPEAERDLVLELYRDLVSVQLNSGAREGAAERALEGVELAEKVFGTGTAAHAKALLNLGRAWLDWERYEKLLEVAEDVVNLCVSISDLQDPMLLGMAYHYRAHAQLGISSEDDVESTIRVRDDLADALRIFESCKIYDEVNYVTLRLNWATTCEALYAANEDLDAWRDGLRSLEIADGILSLDGTRHYEMERELLERLIATLEQGVEEHHDKMIAYQERLRRIREGT